MWSSVEIVLHTFRDIDIDNLKCAFAVKRRQLCCSQLIFHFNQVFARPTIISDRLTFLAESLKLNKGEILKYVFAIVSTLEAFRNTQ